MRTFVIGDVHGHYDRLAALLTRAGLTGIDPEIEIIQLGDLGHYGSDTKERDLAAWEIAHAWHFKVLWGNHDWALFDPARHSFRGQDIPLDATKRLIRIMEPVCAYAANGYLLTHAGLHPNYASVGHTVGDPTKWIANLINHAFHELSNNRVLDDIGVARGGRATQGGILWRDAREELLNVPQVFGHTSRNLIREYNDNSYCIDVGDKHNGNLAGMWLDTREVIAVGPDAVQHESYPPITGE